MKIEYPARFSRKRKGDPYTVTFRHFPEALTEGNTIEEATASAAEVLTLTLEGRMAEKMDIPKPSGKVKKGERLVTPDAQVQTALLLKLSRGERKLAELARKMGTSWSVVQKLENPKHSPTLKQVERAAHALGKQFIIEVK